MRSPIKSVIRNKSKGSFTVPLSGRLNLTFSPTGSEFDTVTLDGDVFSRLENNGAADRLMRLILDDTLELTYKVDSFFAEVIPNTGDSFYAVSGDLAQRIAERSLSVTHNEKAAEPVKEEEPAIIVSGPKASVIEDKVEEKEPEIEEPVKAVEDTPVVEPKPEVEEVKEEAEKPVEEAEKPVEEPVKTKKRAKKIKVD